MSTTTTHAEVAAYVARVRTHLADLGPEVVEELTGGLEADLTDSMESQPVIEGAPTLLPEALFGDPGAYAAELRSSAGLPSPQATACLPVRASVGESVRRGFDEAFAPVRRQPWWPAVRDFLLEVRPAWWVLRGLVVGLLLARVFSPSLMTEVVLGGLGVVLSVELGRRLRRGELRNWRLPVVALNTLLVLAVPVAGFTVDSSQSYDSGYTDESGMVYNRDGSAVVNIFPYGADGKPLTGVRLYDQDGVPITAANSTGYPGESGDTTIPATRYGLDTYSVFPLQVQGPSDFDENSGLEVQATPADAQPPLAAVPALPTPVTSGSPTVSPSTR